MDIPIGARSTPFPTTHPGEPTALTLPLLRTSLVLAAAFCLLLLVALALGHLLPRGEQLVFMSKVDSIGEIYLADVERSISLNISHTPESDEFPIWSPDGSQLAFRLHLDDGGIIGNLYLLDINDGSRHNLTHYDAYYGIPVWSPDGRHLLFESNLDGDFEIYRLDVDCAVPCETNPHLLTTNMFRDYGPIWSPDGSTVVFLSYLESGRTELHSISADGSSPYELTYRNLPADQSLRWSPDGAYILLTVWDGFQFDIFIMDAECIPRPPQQDGPRDCERTLRNLTQNPFDDWSPAWSPDSSQIVFLTNRDGGTEIYRMNISTGDVLRLTDNTAEDRDLAWSPDGRRIAFASNVSGDFEIFVIDADGGNLQRLTYNNSVDSVPDWRPG